MYSISDIWCASSVVDWPSKKEWNKRHHVSLIKSRIWRWIGLITKFRGLNYYYYDLYSQEPSIHSQTPKIFCHIFFNFSASHDVRHLVLPLLLRSSSSPLTVRCLLVNHLWPKTIFHSKEVSISFQLPSLNSV